ncbi:hypothetical protein Glove_64g31 [Diversispora epigaea]|uniref:TLDc domain-containing protein n=1 Tax=Diversispora epigaea TaxID=1348612 RepID=A0A397JFD5_9GLOM|nr:hypothetical protein Glove_64g31 [Diversispora epigaea]
MKIILKQLLNLIFLFKYSKLFLSGIVNIEDMDTKTIYELMIIANELELKELSRKLESYLIKSKASWLRNRFSFNLRRTISLPLRVNEPFSFIINNEHVTEPWVDRKSTIYSLANIPYEFQLILRGSRDDFHLKTFCYMCHGHFGTIMVAKVAGTEEILDGYNPLAWDN